MEQQSSCSDTSENADCDISTSSEASFDDSGREKTPHQESDVKPGIRLPVFPRKSVHVFCSSSNSGKTTLIVNILKHRDTFFESEYVQKVLYVNCNRLNSHTKVENPFESFSELLNVEACALEDLDHSGDSLTSGTLVILDDVVSVNERVNYLATYGANHLDLIVFVVVQSCLSSKLYQLLYKCHTITLAFTNSSSTRLALYILSQFFLSQSKKALLKDIYKRAEQHRWVLTLKLNTVASASEVYKTVLCFGNLAQLFSEVSSYCIVFLEPGETLDSHSMELGTEVNRDSDYLLVEAKHVKSADSVPGSSESATCVDKSRWEQLNSFLVDEINFAFPFNKRSAAIAILKEVLRVREFCVSSDYRTLMIKNKKKVRISIIDFLTVCLRRSGPAENLQKFAPYVPFVKILLRKNIPISYLKNSTLVKLSRGLKPASSKKSHGPSLWDSY